MNRRLNGSQETLTSIIFGEIHYLIRRGSYGPGHFDV
jgi:hypothetical protein